MKVTTWTLEFMCLKNIQLMAPKMIKWEVSLLIVKSLKCEGTDPTSLKTF